MIKTVVTTYGEYIGDIEEGADVIRMKNAKMVIQSENGFGFAKDKSSDRWIKIYQLGSTIIENDVEIGANCTIDRGALGNTHIANGVKLDLSLIHI